MGKHKTKKRITKKRVQKRAQKLKELTAEDLLMNPALLQSPQFKALPLEKQFQLTTQLKQLKTYGLRPMMGGGGYYASGGADSAMYHKLNEVINKNTRQENENAQLKAQYDAEIQRQKQLHEAQAQLTKEQKRREKEMKQREEMNKIEREFDELNQSNANSTLNSLKNQYEQAKKDLRADKIHDTLVQIEFYKENLNQLRRSPKPRRPHVNAEVIHQMKEEKMEKEENLQNQRNAYAENGLFDKVEKTEKKLINLEDEVSEDLKKNSINDEAPDENVNVLPQFQLSDNEKKGIQLEVQLENQKQTLQEQFQQQEELNKQIQENQLENELIIAENVDIVPHSPSVQLSLEKQRTATLNEFHSTVDQIQKLPNVGVGLKPEWITFMSDKIMHSPTHQALRKNNDEAKDAFSKYYNARRELEAKQKTNQAAKSAIVQNTNALPDTSDERVILDHEKQRLIKDFKGVLPNIPFKLSDEEVTSIIKGFTEAKNMKQLDEVFDKGYALLEQREKEYLANQKLEKANEELRQKYQAHNEMAHNLPPSTQNGHLLLTHAKNRALSLLEEVVNKVPNLNQEYRNTLNRRITFAQTQNEVDFCLRKLTRDNIICTTQQKNQQKFEQRKQKMLQKAKGFNDTDIQNFYDGVIDLSKMNKQLDCIEKIMRYDEQMEQTNYTSPLYDQLYKQRQKELKEYERLSNCKISVNFPRLKNNEFEFQKLSPCFDWVYVIG